MTSPETPVSVYLDSIELFCSSSGVYHEVKASFHLVIERANQANGSLIYSMTGKDVWQGSATNENLEKLISTMYSDLKTLAESRHEYLKNGAIWKPIDFEKIKTELSNCKTGFLENPLD